MARIAHFRRTEPCCRPCAAASPPRYRLFDHLDHIVPLEFDGPDTIENLQPICEPCHEAKTARDRGHRLLTRTNSTDGWPS